MRGDDVPPLIYGVPEILSVWCLDRADEQLAVYEYHYPIGDEYYGTVVTVWNADGVAHYHWGFPCATWAPQHEHNRLRKFLRDRKYRQRFRMQTGA